MTMMMVMMMRMMMMMMMMIIIIIIIIDGSNSKVTITKSKKTWLAPEYIYTNAKICNSRHMFNCKKLYKL
jgi:hypothetical protein